MQDIGRRKKRGKMSEYLRNQAETKSVKHLFSGKTHFFEVTNENGSIEEVSIKINCTCQFMGKKGQANNMICSHVLSTLAKICNSADIRIQHEENTLDKRNACKQLIRGSNRHVNQIRYGDNESPEHRMKKQEICFELDKLKKHYGTEMIIEVGDIKLRADILVYDEFKVIEIAKTESDESLEKKRKKYKSIGLTMEVVRI